MATSSRAEGSARGRRALLPSAEMSAMTPTVPPAVIPAAMSVASRDAVRQRVLRARIRLTLAQPFLASAVMRLPVLDVSGLSWCDTAATDGYHIFYNPAWVSGLSDAQLRGLLAHEVMHVLLDHAGRRSERDALGWNLACDHAINLLLRDQGFQLPAGGLIDNAYIGMPAEQIYPKLDPRSWARSPPRGLDWPGGRGTPGAQDLHDDESGSLPTIGADLVDADDPRVRPLRSGDSPDPEQLDALRRELRDEALAKMHGAAAAGLRQACGAEGPGRLDWRALLRAWLQDRIKSDWSSYPFSKKHLHRGLYMPSLGVAAPGHVVFAIDTSGSMSQKVLGEIVAELRAFRETFPCRLTVIQADAAIQQVQEWSEFDGTELPATMPILGRGGTDFRPVFDWLAQQHDAATVVLYATDGMGSFPSRPPPWPVIWLLTPDAVRLSELPFGVGVRMAESLAESFAESLSFASAEDPEG